MTMTTPQAAALALVALALAMPSAHAQSPDGAAKPTAPAAAVIERGRVIVTDKCGGCHAVAKTGASPRREAPPLRTLVQRYPLQNLEEALAEGIVTGHNDMPEFRFEPEEIEAILTYIDSISD